MTKSVTICYLFQPSDILVFSRKMLNTAVFPPNLEFDRKLTAKMLLPDGRHPVETSKSKPKATSEGHTGGAENAAVAAKRAIMAFVASYPEGRDFRLNLNLTCKKQVWHFICNRPAFFRGLRVLQVSWHIQIEWLASFKAHSNFPESSFLFILQFKSLLGSSLSYISPSRPTEWYLYGLNEMSQDLLKKQHREIIQR